MCAKRDFFLKVRSITLASRDCIVITHLPHVAVLPCPPCVAVLLWRLKCQLGAVGRQLCVDAASNGVI